MAKLKPEFDKRNVKVIGLSADPVTNHWWAEDIKETQGTAVNFPMIGDSTLAISKLYNMLPAEAPDSSEGRTAMDNMTVRTVYVIGPDKKIKLMISYPMTTGRNFDEVLRVVDSLQLTAKHKVATPVNWKHGEDVIIAGSVSDDDAKKIYPDGWKSPKPYIRIVPQPSNLLLASRGGAFDDRPARHPLRPCPSTLSIRPARRSDSELSMKTFYCALILGVALGLASAASADPFASSAARRSGSGSITVPPEWAGIWSTTDTTYDCNGVFKARPRRSTPCAPAGHRDGLDGQLHGQRGRELVPAALHGER
jgi:alkyl hydroperoxide reductase subunit AhpC